MPKIIENLREKIIQEAKDQIAINGYESVTIRNIAKGCDIGLGTFYNYFKSKDMLISTFLFEDWKTRINKITDNTQNEKDPMVVVHALYDEVSDFIKAHNGIFSSPSAIKTFSTTAPKYHKFVRNQVAAPIYHSCVLAEIENAEFLSLFVAESVVTWTVAGKSYDEIAAIVSKLFVK
jgi:AcrR family transcriptional regulator